MTLLALLIALLVAICLSTGQLLFKQAAMSIGETAASFDLIKQLVLNPWLFAGLVLYLLTTVVWVLLLRTAPVSVVYPVTGLSFLLVPLASHLIFGEAYSSRILLGGALICAGIALVGVQIK